MKNPRRRCARCRRFACKQPTAKTPIALARKPHDKLCVDCAPVISEEFKPVSAGQISALHAKCNALARLTGKPSVDWKQDVKICAAHEFGLPLGFSFRDLSYEQASWCLDWLEEPSCPDVVRCG